MPLLLSSSPSFRCPGTFATVLAGQPKFPTRQLTSILNCAARIAANLPQFSHVSNHMRDALQRLPVEDMITFKILLLGRVSSVGVASDYIRELCLLVCCKSCRRSLRSLAYADLLVPRIVTRRGSLCCLMYWAILLKKSAIKHTNYFATDSSNEHFKPS